jgi:hypothetical protein
MIWLWGYITFSYIAGLLFLWPEFRNGCLNVNAVKGFFLYLMSPLILSGILVIAAGTLMLVPAMMVGTKPAQPKGPNDTQYHLDLENKIMQHEIVAEEELPPPSSSRDPASPLFTIQIHD